MKRRSLNARSESQPGHTLGGGEGNLKMRRRGAVDATFLLAARAPGIYLDVKLLAVLGQCAQGRPCRPHPWGRQEENQNVPVFFPLFAVTGDGQEGLL